MTPAPQPKKYIITEEQMNLALDDMFEFCRSGELRKVRSTNLEAELQKEGERVRREYRGKLIQALRGDP